MKKLLCLMLVMVMAFSLVACGGTTTTTTPAPAASEAPAENEGGEVEVDPAEFLKGKTIRVVIGSTSVTGDTYLTSDLVTRMISEKYECNIKVDPIGAGRALEEIVTVKGEDTIMMFHDMTYLGVLFGAYDEEDYKLENMIVGASYGFNPGDSFSAVASAPYDTIAELGQWMSENPTETVRLAVEAGGVSQLGFNAIYMWISETYGEEIAANLKAFVTGSTDEKLQALWDGNCQGIYAAASAVEEYTLDGVDDQLKLKVIGLMGGSIEGKDWPTFEEQGIAIGGTPFVFTKEYIACYGLGASKEFVAAMDAAFEDVCNSTEYIEAIEALGYKAQCLTSEEVNEHIYNKRAEMAAVIANCPSFDDLVG
ncbi:MAG: hypothetical protein Q4A39_02370 [Eubacteriales bacterium]|nr:hypothetical protein [Eubacteriales bacterium]